MFPLLPVIDLPFIPDLLYSYTVYFLLFMLSATIFFPRKILMWISLILIILLVVGDQMRWQPWVYIYSLFLFLFAINIKFSLRLFYFKAILFTIYFWSGFHKLNFHFIDYIFLPFMKDVFLLHLPNYKIIGFGIPLIEIFAAMGLLFKKTQKISFLLLTTMHLVILLWVSPWGGNSNNVIIPWNLAMIGLIYFCFYSDFKKERPELKKKYSHKIHSSILIIFFLLPSLWFIEKWPYYFSFHMYSGRGKTMSVIYEQPIIELPENFYLETKNLPSFEKHKIVNLNRWSYQELNVPIPPSLSIFKQLKNHFCNLSPNNSPHFIVYRSINYNGEYDIFTCDDLEL